MPNSKGINIPLSVLFKGLTGGSKGNLNEVTKQFTKVLKPFAKPLGIDIDTRSINTLKDLEALLARLGASVQKTGKNFTVMMQNASGMEAIGNIVAGEVKSGTNKGKTYFKTQDSTYLANRLKPTEQLNQDYKNLITATKELNRLEEKGLQNTTAWDNQVQKVKEYNKTLRQTTEEYTKQFRLRTTTDDRLGGKEVWESDGALAKIQRNREFELQRIQTTHQSAMAKKSQDIADANEIKAANQALGDYLTTSNELIRAKEKLAKMQTKGYYDKEFSQEEITTQEQYIKTLESRQGQFSKNASGAENYAHAVEQVKNAENTLETTTKKLIQQEAQRNIQRRQQQDEVNVVNKYVSALQTQYREEEKLARLQQGKAPKEVIQAQQEVVNETRRQTQAVEGLAKNSEQYAKVQDKVVLAEKQHKQALAELTNTTQKGVGIFGKFKQTLQQVVSAGLSWKIFSAITQTAKQTIETVKELDKSLVDLQIATGDTRQQAEDLLKTYNQMAKELGATTTEVANAADAWLRQGYSTEQTNELIRSSMVLSKIGQIESAEATQYLTSALKGFDIEAEKSIEIVDKLAAIDLISATNASGLAEALSRTAASARLAGVEMEQLLGYVAVVGETTQKSMSQVGESKIEYALKTA